MNVAALLYALALGISLFTLLALIGGRVFRMCEAHVGKKARARYERRMVEILTTGEEPGAAKPV